MKKKFILIMCLSLVFLFQFVSAITTGDSNGNIINFTGVGEVEISGMCSNETNWFIANQADNKIWRTDANGVGEFSFDVGFTTGEIGLVCDNESLYTFRLGSGIYRFYHNGTNMAGSGPFYDTEEFGDSIYGIVVNETYLWANDEDTQTIGRWFLNGTYDDTITVSGSVSFLSWMSMTNNYFWLTGNGNIIYKHYLNGSYADINFTADSGEITSGNSTHLFVSDAQGMVYSHELNTLTISIDEPEAQVYSYNESLLLNFTYSNSTELSSMWFYVLNSTDGVEVANTTISDFLNTTFNVSQDDTYTIYLYLNNSDNQIEVDSVTFGVSTTKPAVVLDYPPNNNYFSDGDNIYFNFTATDSDGLDTCELWSNWSGEWALNYSWVSPPNATQNFTIVNLTDFVGIWNIKCNDTLGNIGWGLNNRTIGVDTIYPLVEITDPENDSSTNSLALTILYNVSDLNINNCFFTLRNSTGSIHNYAENTSVSCSEEGSRAISTLTYGTYTFELFGKDKAGNTNSTILTFSNSAPDTGGGGSPVEVPVTNIVAFARLENMVGTYDLLSLAKVYAGFYRECTSRYPNAKCDLNNDILTKLSNDLSMKVEEYNPLDKQMFYSMYKNGQTEVFQVAVELANEFKLIRDTEGINLLLEVKPNPLDKWWVKNAPWEELKDYKEFLVYSNKPMKDCEVLNGNTNNSYFECELIVNDEGFSNTAIVRLYETDDGIFSETYATTIMWTAIEKDQNHFQRINVRMVNVGHKSILTLGLPFIYSLIVYLILIFIGVGVYSTLKQGKKSKWIKFINS